MKEQNDIASLIDWKDFSEEDFLSLQQDLMNGTIDLFEKDSYGVLFIGDIRCEVIVLGNGDVEDYFVGLDMSAPNPEAFEKVEREVDISLFTYTSFAVLYLPSQVSDIIDCGGSYEAFQEAFTESLKNIYPYFGTTTYRKRTRALEARFQDLHKASH